MDDTPCEGIVVGKSQVGSPWCGRRLFNTFNSLEWKDNFRKTYGIGKW